MKKLSKTHATETITQTLGMLYKTLVTSQEQLAGTVATGGVTKTWQKRIGRKERLRDSILSHSLHFNTSGPFSSLYQFLFSFPISGPFESFCIPILIDILLSSSTSEFQFFLYSLKTQVSHSSILLKILFLSSFYLVL